MRRNSRSFLLPNNRLISPPSMSSYRFLRAAPRAGRRSFHIRVSKRKKQAFSEAHRPPSRVRFFTPPPSRPIPFAAAASKVARGSGCVLPAEERKGRGNSWRDTALCRVGGRLEELRAGTAVSQVTRAARGCQSASFDGAASCAG